MYVEELIGPETVNTMPLETIEAFQDHGEVPRRHRARGRRRGRRRCSSSSPTVGVDYDDVVETLEAEGVQKFADSFDELIEEHRGRSAARSPPRERAREIVERIWARDPTVWTGADEAKWLGWLDEPWRMREDVDLLLQFADVGRRRTSTRSCCSGWAARRSRPR